MTIKINDIPPEGTSFECDQKLDLFNAGPLTELKAVLHIRPTGGGDLRITGRVQANPSLECSRCLTQFSFPIDTEVSIDLASEKAQGPASEHELNRAELDMEFYQGEEIDPLEYAREQILLAIPMVPLHRPDCKGLCPACGTDLNKAECGCRREREGFGPFSGLKDLLNK